VLLALAVSTVLLLATVSVLVAVNALLVSVKSSAQQQQSASNMEFFSARCCLQLIFKHPITQQLVSA